MFFRPGCFCWTWPNGSVVDFLQVEVEDFVKRAKVLTKEIEAEYFFKRILFFHVFSFKQMPGSWIFFPRVLGFSSWIMMTLTRFLSAQFPGQKEGGAGTWRGRKPAGRQKVAESCWIAIAQSIKTDLSGKCFRSTGGGGNDFEVGDQISTYFKPQ